MLEAEQERMKKATDKLKNFDAALIAKGFKDPTREELLEAREIQKTINEYQKRGDLTGLLAYLNNKRKK